MKYKPEMYIYEPKCRFHIISWDTETSVVCGQPAVAIYVSADTRLIAKPICKEHTLDAFTADGEIYLLVRADRSTRYRVRGYRRANGEKLIHRLEAWILKRYLTK